jgi:hypothetical protein
MAPFTKVNHHTADSALALLRGALALVDELDPPADLREAAFTTAAGLLNSHTLVPSGPPQVLPAMAIPRNHGRQ